jgi:hypothetical protein
MVGAVLGLIQNRPTDPDDSVEDSVKIFSEVFVKEKSKCEFIYRIIMLSHRIPELNVRQRADKAFREDGDPSALNENVKVFNAYVRGCIEYLYEQFTDNCNTKDDVLNKVHLFVERFRSDLESRLDDEILSIFNLK